jgi:hypothetical protein
MIEIDQATLDRYPDEETGLRARMRAIERMIRGSTNNNFQRRDKRFLTTVTDGALPGAPSWFLEGDTVQIDRKRRERRDLRGHGGRGRVLTVDGTLRKEFGCTVGPAWIESPGGVVTRQRANDLLAGLRWNTRGKVR